LGETETQLIEDERRAQISQATAMLPWVLIAYSLVVCTVVAATLAAGRDDLLPILALPSLCAVALGLVGLLASRHERWRVLPVHFHVRSATFYGACIGICSGVTLWGALGLTPGGLEAACIVAVAWAAGITAITLCSLRAALLAFATTLAVTFAIMLASAAVAFATVAFLLCLNAAMYRLGRLDLEQIGERTRSITEGVRATRLVEELESNASGWFWETDRAGRLTYLSEKVLNAVGTAAGSPIGRLLTEVFEIDSAAPDTERTLNFHISARTSFSDYSVRAIGGQSDRWWSISGRPFIDELGQFRGFIGSGNDLTERRRSEAEVQRLALFDALTGLANRQRMRVSLDQALSKQGVRYDPTALFLLDLDRFKAVNDTLGHQTGDVLLKQVAQRLLRAVGDAGLVGRLGGDEFKVILPGESNRERLAELSKSIIESLSHPYVINGTSISIGCSIGVAIAPENGEDSDTLIRNADLALYAAKADGRGVHRFYRDELLVDARNRKKLEDDIRHAMNKGEFRLAYQPVVSTEDARIVGYEALLRWEHPKRGPISPAEFIPVAEDCGLIEQIGEWVMRTACIEAAAWAEPVRVAVNVSPIQFANPALPMLVTSALARSGLAPSRLELEITEGVFLDETAAAEKMFDQLKALGVRLALDDFGTGYSSLGYLKKAPFDKIKIDQSFVRGAILPGSRNAAIIKAIVTLANTLQMETTAEGVEIQDEITLIRELGCSHIQGYVYGKPIPAEEVIVQLRQADGHARPMGVRISRAPRLKMLRSARIEASKVRRTVRIRNISTTGVMIEGAEVQPETELLIELLPGEMFRATVRWVDGAFAGLQFARPFDTERLNTLLQPRQLRRSA
jgi:diguanylate cyclase (GGDEF)-like protein